MKKLLITGGAGFIGANFIEYFMDKYPEDFIVNVDKLTYASDYSNIEKFESNKQYVFEQIDICDEKKIEEIIKKYKIDTIIHFAAESHVDNSIENPRVFAETNIMGTLNLLQQAYKQWFIKPFQLKEEYENSRFIHVSTDEVYGTLESEGYFTEESKYLPNSPYSASKAASDLLVRSFYHTYGMSVITTNCSNNFGPYQNNEKLIPKVIYNALNNLHIPVYGSGANVRDWLYVQDHCLAIDLVLQKGEIGDTYLIGGTNERKNLDIIHKICEILDYEVPKEKSYSEQIKFVEDRFGHDFRYAIDATKLKRELGWETSIIFEDALANTVKWYVEKYKGN